MSGQKIAIAALALAAPMLGGCQSIFGGKLTIRPIENGVQPGGGASYASAQVEAGRAALGSGRLSDAIVAFRNARLDPSQAAAACNGLGVAYSQLGRPDLAERYFRQAVSIAPADRRYQANLQRFYRLNPVELTMSASDRQAPAVPVAAPETRLRLAMQSGAATTLVVTRPGSRLVRLSAGEVRIGGAPSAPAPKAPSLAGATGKPAAGYPIRIGFAPREVFVGKAPPAFASVAAARPAVQVAAKQHYPLRVKIGSR